MNKRIRMRDNRVEYVAGRWDVIGSVQCPHCGECYDAALKIPHFSLASLIAEGERRQREAAEENE